MYKSGGFLLCVLFFLSCKTPSTTVAVTLKKEQPTQTYQEQKENMEQGIYFRAKGLTPAWHLKIGANDVQFSSTTIGFEQFNAPHVTPSRAMDANVKRYRMTTETGTMLITIEQKMCTTSDGENFPYEVRVEIEKGKDKAIATFEGCGAYVIDPKLHDIWALEKMNGEHLSSLKFQKEIPYLEINSNSGTFMGFAGCNRMNGSLFFEKGLLRFTNISTTRMACESQNRESELLTSLESITTYQIDNLRLILTNSSGIELVFKKVD